MTLVVGLAAGHCHAADTKIVLVKNSTGMAASDLHLTFAGTGGSIEVIPGTLLAPSACPAPVLGSAGNTVDIDWGEACIADGSSVLLAVTSPFGPLSFAGGHWTGPGGAVLGPVAQGDLIAPSGIVVPVRAFVTPPCGGAAVLREIGSIVAFAANQVDAFFVLRPEYRYLDRWYDFKWVNVIIEDELPGMFDLDVNGDGCCDLALVATGPLDSDGDGNNETWLPFPQKVCPDPQNQCGTAIAYELPCIDGQPGQDVGRGLVSDGLPYYHDEPDEWESEHAECEFSHFFDKRGGPPGNRVRFRTFVVIDGVTDPLALFEFWVLDGFEWEFQRPAGGGPGTKTVIGPLAPDVALINQALQNPKAGANPGPASFDIWTASKRDDCPLAECPVQLKAECTNVAIDVNNPQCCIFEWKVTNNGPLPVTEFFLDLEAGSGGGQICREVTLPGWDLDECYPWDGATPSNWTVLRFVAQDTDGDGKPDGLNTGDSVVGMASIGVNGDDPVEVAIPNWHRFVVPAKSVVCHISDYTPKCMAVSCKKGEFGPHIRSDRWGRNQACFWKSAGVWSCAPPCKGDLNDDGVVDGGDLAILLGLWGTKGTPGDLNGDGMVEGCDIGHLLAAWGPCP